MQRDCPCFREVREQSLKTAGRSAPGLSLLEEGSQVPTSQPLAPVPAPHLALSCCPQQPQAWHSEGGSGLGTRGARSQVQQIFRGYVRIAPGRETEPPRGSSMAAPIAVFADYSFLLNIGISGKGNWKNPQKYCW